MKRQRKRDPQAGAPPPSLSPSSSPSPSDRIQSGNPQADSILAGGFPANSINIVMGHPGTGKTIFAEQLLFYNATGDRPLLYVTTLSEPLNKVVSYVQRFTFFQADKLGTVVQYEDFGAELAQKGPGALTEWLREAIKTRSPKIIVIDSFRAIHDLAMSADAMRRFISEFAGILSAYDVTAFLLGEYTSDDIECFPEFAVADAIIELARQPLSTRDERYLRVIKLRGSGYREGQHAFRITDSGLEIYPRLVTPRVPEHYESLTRRLGTGVPALDKILGGGLFAGSTTLVVGSTGSGKTTLSLQFALEGIKQGEKVLYINFQENPAQLRQAIANLGGNHDLAQTKGLTLLYASPVELQIDSIVVDIFDAIEQQGVRRLVIDALGDLASAASDSQRLHDYLYSLIQHFSVRGVTTMMTLESGEAFTANVPLAGQRFSYMSDNLIFLGTGGKKTQERTLRIVKMRGSAHEREPRDFDITAKGVKIR